MKKGITGYQNLSKSNKALPKGRSFKEIQVNISETYTSIKD